jgi:hypothetical protein
MSILINMSWKKYKHCELTTVNSTFLSPGIDFRKTGWWKVFSHWDLQNEKNIVYSSRQKGGVPIFLTRNHVLRKTCNFLEIPVVGPNCSLCKSIKSVRFSKSYIHSGRGNVGASSCARNSITIFFQKIGFLRGGERLKSRSPHFHSLYRVPLNR